MTKETDTFSISTITNPDEALQTLKDGNKRFVDGETINQEVDFVQKKLLSEIGQAPFAIVLSCADSRLLPKRVFDQKIGDLFMLRIAGNIVSPEEIGSMEFSVEAFNSCLIVIMGHQGCGAITAAVKSNPDHPAVTTKNIDTIMNRLQTVVVTTADQKNKMTENEYIDYCIDQNVVHGLKELVKQSELIKNKISEGKLKIVGAKYLLDTGEVVFNEFQS